MTYTHFPSVPICDSHIHSIACGGASAYAPFGSIYAYEIAGKLGADFWKIDVQITADGVLVSHCDITDINGTHIHSMDYGNLFDLYNIPLLETLMGVVIKYNAGLYLDIKDPNAIVPTCEMLQRYTITNAVFAVWDIRWLERIKNMEFPYKTAVFIGPKQDPFVQTQSADFLHLCWKNHPHRLNALTPEVFKTAHSRNQQIVLWHEQCPNHMQALRKLPVWGICSDCPEWVKPLYSTDDMGKNIPYKPNIVAHRGNKHIAPENSVPAFESALRAGCGTIELDVHITADGQLVVFHDFTMERSANGTGQDVITTHTYADLQQYDIGAWFHPHFAGTKIPTLKQILTLAKHYNADVYVDLKSAPADKVITLIQNMDMVKKCFFWSFVLYTTKTIHTLCPQAKIMSRRQDFTTLTDCIKYADAHIIEYTHTEDFSEFSVLQDKNIQTMIAYDGTDTEIFDTIISAQPDRVNIHHPMEFIKYLTTI